MIQWVIEKRKISELKPHPHNPRKLSKHDYEHLKKSIDKYGLIDKPVITQDGSILGGHQRIEILKKNKVKEVECWVPKGKNLKPEEMKEVSIRLNRNHGDWDFDILANAWDEDELLDFGFEDWEFTGETPPKPTLKPPQLTIQANTAKDFDKLEEAVKKVLKDDLIKITRKHT